MDQQTRLEATKAIWTAIAFILIAMFVTTGIWGDGMSGGHIFLGVILAMAGMGSTSFVWDSAKKDEDSEQNQEKAKRERIDKVIRDLSDEDLLRLKSRLVDGSIDDDVLYEHMTLTDDGELVPMERRS